MNIYEVNGQFYTDRNQAVIEAIGTHYAVKTHELNDSENMESYREHSDVYIESENEERIDIDYDIDLVDNSDYFEESQIWEVSNIKIKDKLIELIDIDEDLKAAILYDVEMVAEKKNDEK